MLYFVSAELALGYWLFAFLCVLGALQWVAVRYRLAGLAFLRSRVWGYALAALLVVGGTAAFFISQWGPIFAPGPAGSELAVLFGTSAICALAFTLIFPPLFERWREGVGAGSEGDEGQLLTLGHATARLYLPPGQTTLAPAVCLLPACPVGAALTPAVDLANPAGLARDTRLSSGYGEPAHAVGMVQPAQTAEARSMSVLARRLAAEGVVALVVNPDEQSYAFPAILATLPAAVAVLRERPEVDPNRIGALGEDLGADWVIRAASTSREIKAVAALAPVLANVSPGLDLLSEMSYLQALHWARDRKRATLCRELNAVEYGPRIPPRPFLLLYGEDDRLAGDVASVAASWGQSGTGQVQVIPDLGHLGLASHPAVMEIVSQWLKEHL